MNPRLLLMAALSVIMGLCSVACSAAKMRQYKEWRAAKLADPNYQRAVGIAAAGMIQRNADFAAEQQRVANVQAQKAMVDSMNRRWLPHGYSGGYSPGGWVSQAEYAKAQAQSPLIFSSGVSPGKLVDQWGRGYSMQPTLMQGTVNLRRDDGQSLVLTPTGRAGQFNVRPN